MTRREGGSGELKAGAMGLPALEARLASDLAMLNLPPALWVPPLIHPEGEVLEAAIIGAGMNGLTAAMALRLVGICARIFDKAPLGKEGPWVTTARRFQGSSRGCAAFRTMAKCREGGPTRRT